MGDMIGQEMLFQGKKKRSQNIEMSRDARAKELAATEEQIAEGDKKKRGAELATSEKKEKQALKQKGLAGRGSLIANTGSTGTNKKMGGSK